MRKYILLSVLCWIDWYQVGKSSGKRSHFPLLAFFLNMQICFHAIKYKWQNDRRFRWCLNHLSSYTGFRMVGLDSCSCSLSNLKQLEQRMGWRTSRTFSRYFFPSFVLSHPRDSPTWTFLTLLSTLVFCSCFWYMGHGFVLSYLFALQNPIHILKTTTKY